MSLSLLPPEVLGPILHHAIEPGTSAGAGLVLVSTLFHDCGRARLYQKVVLASQAGWDSFFLLGRPSPPWRPLARSQRAVDYACLLSLKLSYAPLSKIPSHLSLSTPSLFPRLRTLHLDLAKGSSYLSERPKPMARRVAKLMGDFSADTLFIAKDSSAEISLAALHSHHFAKTREIFLASHQIGHIPRLSAVSAPLLERIVVIPYPAVRARDLKLLGMGLRGTDVLVEVRFGGGGWWQEEARLELELDIGDARARGEEWVERVLLIYGEEADFDEEDDGEEGDED